MGLAAALGDRRRRRSSDCARRPVVVVFASFDPAIERGEVQAVAGAARNVMVFTGQSKVIGDPDAGCMFQTSLEEVAARYSGDRLDRDPPS